MRVCFIGTSPSPTTRVRGYEFASHLRKHGFETGVLEFWKDPSQSRSRGPAKVWLPNLYANLLKEVIRYGPDMIYLLKPLPRAALVAAFARKLLGSRFIFDSDDYELKEWFHPVRNEIILRAEKYLATHADAVVVASRMLGERISSFGVQDSKIHHIQTGVDTDFFRPLKVPKKSRKVLIFTGIRVRENLPNISLMFRALRLVAGERRDFEVLLTGWG